MRVVIGSDHAGFQLKEYLKQRLVEWQHEVEDLGTHSTASTDYPDFAAAVGRRVVESSGQGTPTLGVLVCGSGVGISIAANKVHGVRAACCSETYSAKMSRLHNDANVLCMGERVVGHGVAEAMVHEFLTTAFEGGRHQRRVDKIGALEK